MQFSIISTKSELPPICNKKGNYHLTMKRRYAFPLLLLCLILSGCSDSKSTIEKTGFLLDTVITITLYGTEDEFILDNSFAICEKYEQLLSTTIPTSDIAQINDAGGQPVKVSEDTSYLIKKALYYSELSNGTFDITIAPLSSLWDFKDKKTIPAPDAIEKNLPLVDYRTVQVEGDIVTLKNPKAAIDLGGIAKGYIADQIKEYLLSEGISSALINLGGNVLTVGEKADGSAWNIGIQKPFDEQNTAITSVQLSDESVVTSGVYERFFEKNGKLYHHILNPATGYPFDNGLYGVTIISKSSMDGDALSTSCFALGLTEGMKLIQSLPDIEAIFITDDLKLHDSRDIASAS